VDESASPLLLELAVQSQRGDLNIPVDADEEEEKRLAIAKCRKRIDNAKALCLAGDISSDDYLRIKEQNEREIAHWQARTNDVQDAALELALCMETVDKLKRLWDIATDEDKQGMVQMLFEYVEYDLDARRITDFRLKPWADKFLILRAALYETNLPHPGEAEKEENATEEETQSMARITPPEGFRPIGVPCRAARSTNLRPRSSPPHLYDHPQISARP
jgi:hypothetical protein